MSRDWWTTKRAVVSTNRIKKSLTIPASTYTCAPVRASVYVPVSTSPLRLNGGATIALSSTTITLDFWMKHLKSLTANYTIVQLINGSAFGVKLKIAADGLVIEFITSGGTYTITTGVNYYNSWVRYSIVFDSVNNKGYFYANMVLIGSVATTGNLSTNVYSLTFGDLTSAGFYAAYFNEIAVYTNAKTADGIINTNAFKGNFGVYGIGLNHYWHVNNLAASISTLTVGTVDLFTGASLSSLKTDTYAPIGYGASFIVALTEITLGKIVSLKFPKTMPTNCTGQLCVSWSPSRGVVNRRKIWTLAGVDIGSKPALYEGEPIISPFRLEWWNIDGNEKVTIPSDVIVNISDTTIPTNSYDHTPVVAATPTMDTTLAEVFPLTFPLTFNTQQSY